MRRSMPYRIGFIDNGQYDMYLYVKKVWVMPKTRPYGPKFDTWTCLKPGPLNPGGPGFRHNQKFA